MKLIDNYTERIISLPELCAEWREFSQEEPHNHADNFKTELFEIIMATVNGRNDCDIIGMTPAETERYIRRLRKEIEKQ